MIFKSVACAKCRDLGVLELSQGAFTTLALCDCEWGKSAVNLTWALPRIEVSGYTHQPIKAHLFIPTLQMPYEEKINWWRERVRTAESFWKEQGG